MSMNGHSNLGHKKLAKTSSEIGRKNDIYNQMLCFGFKTPGNKGFSEPGFYGNLLNNSVLQFIISVRLFLNLDDYTTKVVL